MNECTREKLTELKRLAVAKSETEVPVWLLETLIENVTKLLSEDATQSHVVDKMIGGLRALADAPSVPDDDPVMAQIVSIVDDSE